MTLLKLAQFGSLLLTVLAVTPAMAHLIELPTKLRLDARDYVVVQRVYRGLDGVLTGAAILSIIILGALVYRDTGAFLLVALALLFSGATQAIFWAFTFPVNRATCDWTLLPTNWSSLRSQWEYATATSAALGWASLIALLASVLVS